MKRLVLLTVSVAVIAAMASCKHDKASENPVQLYTQPVSTIGFDSAAGSGYITVGNPSAFSERGICWSSEPSPTVDDNISESDDPTDERSFSASLTGLSPLSTYYVRAYISDGVNIHYGNELSFTTINNPSRNGWCLAENIEVTPSSAGMRVVIADDGGILATELGLCYGEEPDPDIDDLYVIAEPRESLSFHAEVNGLLQNTVYYARPYFRTAEGDLIYGENVSFKTLNFIRTDLAYPGYKTAYLFAEVVDDAGSETSEKGICWGSTPEVTIETGSHINIGKGKGEFHGFITGLAKGTTYYMRGYAVNASGTFYGLPVEFTTKTGSPIPGGVLEDMIKVETDGGATFLMGYPPGDDGTVSALWSTTYSKELTHTVTLTKNFYMSRYEITNEQMCAFLNSYPIIKSGNYNFGRIYPTWAFFSSAASTRQNSFRHPGEVGKFEPMRANGAKHPTNTVTYTAAYEYCRWLSAELGVAVRMPNEAEWEFAARGGKLSQGYTFAGGNTLNDVAVTGRTSATGPLDVGTKTPNELGLYDMSGNIFEFCNDIYSDAMQVYVNGIVDPLWNPNPNDLNAGLRTIRGGSYRHGGDTGYPALGRRGRTTSAGEAGDHLGFRIVMDKLPASFE